VLGSKHQGQRACLQEGRDAGYPGRGMMETGPLGAGFGGCLV
jgi:hypothetical protein